MSKCIICNDNSEYGKPLCLTCWMSAIAYSQDVLEGSIFTVEELKKELKIAKKALEEATTEKEKQNILIHLYAIAYYAEEYLYQSDSIARMIDFIKSKITLCNLEDFINEQKQHTKQEIDNEQEYTSNCILCEKEAYGYLFCYDCYNKYKDTPIHIRFINGVPVKDSYRRENLHYKCEDGHWVRSQQERTIDDFLYKNKIWHEYESALESPLEETSKPIHPDFYLPELDVYIEHHGITNSAEYDEINEYKEPYFEGKRVIYTTPEDIIDPKTSLPEKLGLKQSVNRTERKNK